MFDTDAKKTLDFNGAATAKMMLPNTVNRGYGILGSCVMTDTRTGRKQEWSFPIFLWGGKPSAAYQIKGSTLRLTRLTHFGML